MENIRKGQDKFRARLLARDGIEMDGGVVIHKCMVSGQEKPVTDLEAAHIISPTAFERVRGLAFFNSQCKDELIKFIKVPKDRSMDVRNGILMSKNFHGWYDTFYLDILYDEQAEKVITTDFC